VLSAVTTSVLVCVAKLFILYVAVCCLCVCVPDVLVCGMFGCELFTTKHPSRGSEDVMRGTDSKVSMVPF
jgi:hypothetical protein